MNNLNLIKFVCVSAALLLSISVFCQSFPTGGYQGGMHGNIKVITWSGAVDNDWSKPGNWCPAKVPEAQDNVVVPAAPAIMPEVKTNGLSCKSVNLEPGASVTIKPGYVLTVNGQETQ